MIRINTKGSVMISGKDKIAKILSHMSTQDSKEILESISMKNNQLADEIKELMFTFDDILDLSVNDMQILHKKIQTNDLLLAVKDSSDEIKDKLFSGVSNRKKTIFVEEFELIGKVKRSDIEAARQRIMDTIREMVEQGEISLDDEWVE
jgi:flagellar motor switch protein FliG